MGVRIGALSVSLSADTAKFQSGLKRAEAQAKASSSVIQKSLGGIKAGFAGLAAGLSIGLVVQGIKGALDYAGSLAEVAQQLGVTTKQLQVYRFAAEQVGVSQEKLEIGLSKLNVSLGAAKLGAKGPVDAFGQLSKIIGKDIVAASKQGGGALPLVADGLAKITDRAVRAKIEVLLFGKAGAALDNLLSGGSAAINELSAAAEKLGIVLSDEQIKNADETADKLHALHTVLSAQIAGVVADNAQAILALANALVAVAAGAAKALGNFSAFVSFMSKNLSLIANPTAAFTTGLKGGNGGNVRGLNKAGKSVTIDLPPAKITTPSGVDVDKFLASGGGSKKAKKGPKDRTLQNTFQFEDEQRRADIDILRAKQQLAKDYTERTALSIEILNAEKKGFEAELVYRIALYKQTKGQDGITEQQAKELKTRFDINDSLQRQFVLQEEEEQRQKDYNELGLHDLDRQRDILESKAQLAETASERRKIELEILELAYQQKRQALQNILETSKDFKEIEDARRDLLTLNKTEANDRAGVIAGTRGPMEDWLASLPTTAAKAQEAFEQLEVQGFEGLIDAATALTEGFGSAKKVLLDTLKQFLAGLLRMQLQKGLGSILQNVKLPGFASGGFTGNIGQNTVAGFVHGGEGVLNTRGLQMLGVPNLNALNRGVPIAAVSNDNSGGTTIVQNFNVTTPDADGFRRNQSQIARNARRGLRI
jgi:hypothetical protein